LFPTGDGADVDVDVDVLIGHVSPIPASSLPTTNVTSNHLDRFHRKSARIEVNEKSPSAV
jgi:hypothetical protein